MAKNSKNIFLFFSRPSASFSYIITIYIDQISKNRFLGRFGTVRPKFWRTGVFGPNRFPLLFSNFGPLTFCTKISEILRAIFQKNIDLCHFWLFWAVLGPLGPISGKPDFSGKIRLCNFSSNIIPQLDAKFQKHPTASFPEL